MDICLFLLKNTRQLSLAQFLRDGNDHIASYAVVASL